MSRATVRTAPTAPGPAPGAGPTAPVETRPVADWNPDLRYQDAVRLHTPAELDRLRALIAAVGRVLDPLKITRDDRLLDGHARLSIARKLGLTAVPVVVVEAATAEDEAALAVRFNVDRRHLSRAEVEAKIAVELKRNANRSNREVAKETGEDHRKVAKVRKGLAATGQIDQLAAVPGKDGRTRPLTRPARSPAGGRKRVARAPLRDSVDAAPAPGRTDAAGGEPEVGETTPPAVATAGADPDGEVRTRILAGIGRCHSAATEAFAARPAPAPLHALARDLRLWTAEVTAYAVHLESRPDLSAISS